MIQNLNDIFSDSFASADMGYRIIQIRRDRRFGKLTVLGESAKFHSTTGCAVRGLICKCQCGAIKDIRLGDLRSGRTISCGCIKRQRQLERCKKHGMTHSPEYKVWQNMLNRCRNPKLREWKRYGGRGITVCQRWKNEFAAFLSNVGRRPSPRHTLDRIRNDGNYCPGNVRWVTQKTQCNNKSSNRHIKWNEELHTAKEWSEIVGVGYGTLLYRLRMGWPIYLAMTVPPHKWSIIHSRKPL
jgi:hypothetical protein